MTYDLLDFVIQNSINSSTVPKMKSQNRPVEPKKKKYRYIKMLPPSFSIFLERKDNKSLALFWKNPQRHRGIHAFFLVLVHFLSGRQKPQYSQKQLPNVTGEAHYILNNNCALLLESLPNVTSREH